MPHPLRVLYICYYPLTEPLVQSQVVAYLAGLAKKGHIVHLLTFETERHTPEQKRQWQRYLRVRHIHWYHLRYHKRPSLPATLYDVLCGVLAGLRIIRRHRIQLVHARSHVPATIGLILKRLTGCGLLFDIRGLLAEEYVDAGNWQKDSLPFRLTKVMERYCIKDADGLVVLTERVKHYLFGGGADDSGYSLSCPLRVIPCCADLSQIREQEHWRDSIRAELGVTDKNLLIYVGKFGGWYLQRETAEFVATACGIIPNLHFLVLTQSDPQLVLSELTRCNMPGEAYTITQVRSDEVGKYLAAADCAISFIAPCLSKIASSPTKIGEYLAAGLPVICNSGIGDVDALIEENQAGVLVREFTPESYENASLQILSLLGNEPTRQRCRRAANENASLQEVGVPRYHSLYTEIAQGKLS